MKKILILLFALMLFLTGCEKTEPEPEPAEPEVTLRKVGEEVSFHDMKWNLIRDEDPDSDYITVVSSEIIVPDSIYFEDDLLFDTIRYFSIDKLKYEDSGIKIYLEEELLKDLGEESLKEVDGHKIRLLTLADITAILPMEKHIDDNDIAYYKQSSSDDYSWLVRNNTWFWTMEPANDDIVNIVYGESMAEQYIHYSWYVLTNENGLLLTSVGNHKDDGIKVVINLLKSAVTE